MKTIIQYYQKIRTTQPIEGKLYYQISLVATNDKSIELSWRYTLNYSGKKSWTSAISPINPAKAMKLFDEIHEPAVLINNKSDLFVYLHIGGHGIIEQEICQLFFPNIIQPKELIQSSEKGLIPIDKIPVEWLRRNPTNKKRIELLKRDKLRCRICGRSPDNYIDLELHLHHIVPWSKGGLSEDQNLITLCKTCHVGLDPHYDPELFLMIGIDTRYCAFTLDQSTRNYYEGLKKYHSILCKKNHDYNQSR